MGATLPFKKKNTKKKDRDSVLPTPSLFIVCTLTLLSGGFERKEGLTIDYVTLRRAKKRGEKNERKAD